VTGRQNEKEMGGKTRIKREEKDKEARTKKIKWVVSASASSYAAHHACPAGRRPGATLTRH
jgi:hypothetical protein